MLAYDASSLAPNLTINVGSAVYSLLATADWLLIGSAAGIVHFIDLNKKTEVRALKVGDTGVFMLVLSPDGRQLISGTASGVLSLWSWPELEPEGSWRWGNFKVRGMAFNPAGTLAASACGDGRLRLVSVASWRMVDELDAHDAVNAVQFVSDSVLVSCGRDARLKLWRLSDRWQLSQSIDAHNYAIYAAALSPDGQLLATASRDKTLKIWEASMPDLPLRLAGPQGHKRSANTVVWLSDRRLATAGDDGILRCCQLMQADA